MSEPKSETKTRLDLSHDRQKNRILTAENPASFLQAVGIMTTDGRIKADMQRKFNQVNEFLRLVDEVASFPAGSGRAIRVVDFGYGSCHLTFAMYFYLRDILGLEAQVVGVDVKSGLMEQLQAKVEALKWDGLNFQTGYISEYETNIPPEVVLALHACDTATHDALKKGIEWGSQLVMCAPCCQHELQSQMVRTEMPNQLSLHFSAWHFLRAHGRYSHRQFSRQHPAHPGLPTGPRIFLPAIKPMPATAHLFLAQSHYPGRRVIGARISNKGFPS